MSQSQSGDHYAAMQAGFHWLVPRHFNIAQACSARWAALPGAAERVAVIEHRVGGKPATYSYAQLQAQANRLSNALARLGVRTGDRVAIVMPQRFETAVAYMAVLQMGAIAMPLSQLFGPEALEYRLQNAAATVAICDEGALANLLAARDTCLALQTVIGLGAGAERADHEWHALLAKSRDRYAAADPLPDDAAVLIYTSGTTGPPKGALIPQRVLIGNLPGFVCSQNWFGFDPVGVARPAKETPSPVRGREGAGTFGAKPSLWEERKTRSVFWSPADWAWTGGLMDALLPTLYFGRPIVAHNSRFDPLEAFEILSRHRVTHAFLFPTALKAMMKAVPHPRPRHALHLQGLMSAGEAAGDAVFTYCRKELGVVVNEMFGQTEVNYIVGNCAMNDHRAPAAAPGRSKQGAAPSGGSEAHAVASVGTGFVGWPARAGSMGRGYPGHLVALIDDKGEEVPVGEPGEVAIRRTDIHGH
ncbi:MAG TPA: AMP-binding protein, partial [Ottowia sp.]|nr:AMP-binding protein [Ottowia sp.]